MGTFPFFFLVWPKCPPEGNILVRKVTLSVYFGYAGCYVDVIPARPESF